jgi:hypothetical protein
MLPTVTVSTSPCSRRHVVKKLYCNGITSQGERCRTPEVPGFGFCVRHLPDELCDEAAKHGYVRCKAMVRDEASEHYGLRCRQEAVNDSGLCPYHQPNDKWLVPVTREQRRAVARIHTVAEAAGIDTTRVANPLQALLELADEALRFKEECGRRVVALETHEWRYEHIAGEQIRGDILIYERAMDRAMRMLLAVSRLGIEERLARVTERQAVLVEQAIVHALEESGADLKVQDKAREIVAERLRSVS